MNILERDAGIKVTYIQYKGGSCTYPTLWPGGSALDLCHSMWSLVGEEWWDEGTGYYQ